MLTSNFLPSKFIKITKNGSKIKFATMENVNGIFLATKLMAKMK